MLFLVVAFVFVSSWLTNIVYANNWPAWILFSLPVVGFAVANSVRGAWVSSDKDKAAANRKEKVADRFNR